MQIEVMSLKLIKACYQSITKPYIIISIVGNDSEKPTFNPHKYLQDVCYLKFYDIGPEAIRGNDPTSNKFRDGLFNENIARQIIEFIEQYKNRVNLILIHCEAGISRSTAVAAAISKMLNGDDSKFFNSKLYVPNMFIYSTLLNTWQRI